jgi:hypothetical protein
MSEDDARMRSDDARVYRAVAYLAANPLAASVFCAVTDQIGVTGWQLARRSLERPGEIEKILRTLVQINAVRADGHGLDAYYVPSKEAYIFKGVV